MDPWTYINIYPTGDKISKMLNERVQRSWSVCNKVGACAARPERVQLGYNVCSGVRACAAKSERVHGALECVQDFDCVQRVFIMKCPITFAKCLTISNGV